MHSHIKAVEFFLDHRKHTFPSDCLLSQFANHTLLIGDVAVRTALNEMRHGSVDLDRAPAGAVDPMFDACAGGRFSAVASEGAVAALPSPS